MASKIRIAIAIAALALLLLSTYRLNFNQLEWCSNRSAYMAIISMSSTCLSMLIGNRYEKGRSNPHR